MIHEMIDMDTQEKIRYISESSNASTSGYSTMSPGPGGGPIGNLSPASSVFSMSSSPAHSPATVLQKEFSNLNIPTNVNHHQVHQNIYAPIQSSSSLTYLGSNYVNAMSTMSASNALPQHNFALQCQTSHTGRLSNQNIQEYPSVLRIVEHPVEKFRFRYKSEMHGTHGSLHGANSKRSPKTFPEVELCKFQGAAIIRCSLFQTNLDSPHSHQLVVRKDDIDICDPHDMYVSQEKGYVSQFQNMGIIHTAKKYIVEELFRKKKERLRFELGREELSNRQLQELQKDTEKEAKEMNLNQVRLCFEAFKIEENNTWTRIAEPVYTNSINNRKSAQTGELRICRLSIASGSVSGGDDLILLVEKVSKKNIKVRFFEQNDDDEIVWESFGKFRESDVHHQYAIVCQTPPYINKDIDKPVEVCIELLRPSDDERSYPPVSFRYKPREVVATRKRRRTNSVTTNASGSDTSLNSYELPKTLQEQTTNLPMSAPTTTAIATTAHMQPKQQYVCNNAPTISEEFNKEQELNNLLASETFKDFLYPNSEELSKFCNFSDLVFDDIPHTQTDPNVGRLETDGVASDVDFVNISKRSSKNKIDRLNVDTYKHDYMQRILKVFDDLRNEKNFKNEQFNRAAKEVETLFLEHAEQSENGDSIIHEIIVNDNAKIRMKMFQILSVFKLGGNLLNRVVNVNGETGLHCACIFDRALYIRPLLGLGCNPNLQDNDGNTALHISVREQHQKCTESFLNMDGIKLNLTLKNDEGLTPLHLAIRQNNYDIVNKLLKHDKSAVLVKNTKDGNNAVHIAIQQSNIEMIKLVLKDQNVYDILRTRNTAGLTPIDVAKNLKSSINTKVLEYISTLTKDLETKLLIKEEKPEDDEDDANNSSSSNTDDEIEAMKNVHVKQESVDNTDIDNTLNTNLESYSLESALNDADKFNKLITNLNESDKWKVVAEKTKMQHLLCLWSNAEAMLKYVKKNLSTIDYATFANALSEVDKVAFQLLQPV